MIYLASLGHNVVGVELSEMACRAFFEENQIEFEATIHANFKVFSSGKIEIYCGDLFSLTTAMLPNLTAVYDRAALIALPEELRAKYTSHLTNLLSNAGKGLIFLVAIEYSDERKSGPPFSVTSEEVLHHYSDSFEISLLSSENDVTHIKADEPETKIDIIEKCYLMTPKSSP